jgi:carboxypeptidase Q
MATLSLAAWLLLAPLGLLLPTGFSDEESLQNVRSYEQTVRTILAESLRQGRAYERLGELCRVAPRRLSGSPGASAAVEWARQAMQEEGLENIRLQSVVVPHWVRSEIGELRIVKPLEYAGMVLPMLALGGSVATPPGGLRAEIVVVDSLEAGAALGEQAEGRIVLFNGPMDPSLVRSFDAYSGAVGQRAHGASTASRGGAVAALVRSMTTGIDDIPHTGALRYAADTAKIPSAAVSTRGAELIASLTAAGQQVEVFLRQDCRTLPDAEGHNVIGELVGRELPEEVIVVGGHLDAWDVGEGAHDDGGGCCQALEAVSLLQRLGLRPRRTLRVVLFTNEENGLAGGRAYREAYASEMDHHVLALESDSGVFTPRGFSTNANPQAYAILTALSGLLEEAGAGDLRQGGGGADISPMRDDGVIQVGFEPDPQRYFDLHHTHEDTFDKVSPREINLGAGVIAAFLYVVADMEQTLPRNTPPSGH